MAGAGIPSGKRKELLHWRIRTWVCLLMGMCWCNELLIRSAPCLTTQNCWATSEEPTHGYWFRVPEPLPACLARPRYPSMPWRPHHPGVPWGPYSIITWFISSYPQPSLILSLSPVLLPKIPFLWSKHYIWGRCAFKEKETSSHPASKINLTNTPGEVCFDIYIAQKYFFLKWSIFLFFTLHPCSDFYLSRKYYEDI